MIHRIPVSAAHISEGQRPRDPGQARCFYHPLALALNDYFAPYACAKVLPGYLILRDRAAVHEGIHITHSEALHEFVRAADYHEPLTPFVLHLHLAHSRVRIWWTYSESEQQIQTL